MILSLDQVSVPDSGSGVISFDFDSTMRDGATGAWKEAVISLVKAYLRSGFTVVVVTSRYETDTPNSADAARSLLKGVDLGHLQVISAPGDTAHYPGAPRFDKSEALLQLGAFLHFDDWPRDPDLKRALESGVTIVEVPLSAQEREMWGPDTD